MQLGNKVGRAVKVDKTTMAVSEGRFAQIRIQINLRKSLVPYISLLGYLKVEKKAFILSILSTDIAKKIVLKPLL